MRAAICVFTGTGNTERVLRALKEEWEKLGHTAEYFPVRADNPVPDLSDFDLLIVGHPVHAFNAPAPLLKFLKKLPKQRKGAKRPAYLVHVSGEPLRLNNASGITSRRILKKRGFEVLGEFGYVMPYNIIFRHSEKMAARMWQDAESVLPEDTEKIARLAREKVRIGGWRRLVAFVLRIEHTAMPVIGRSFKAKKKLCVGCGVCEQLCKFGAFKKEVTA